MNIIPQNSNNYLKVVNITDSHNYIINVDILGNDEAVTCPFDKDMLAGKDEHGNVCIVKKRLLPFLKTFHKKN